MNGVGDCARRRTAVALVDGDAHVGSALGAPTFENAATLTLAAPTPDSMVDALFERKFEACTDYRAVFADLAGPVDAGPIAGKEGGWWV